MKQARLILIACFVVLQCTAAFGGSTQHQGPSKFSEEALSGFAKNVERFAAAHGAQVFLISRLGQPKENLPKDVHYTHVAIAVYTETTTESEQRLRGYAIYNLYQDYNRRNRSTLVTDYPVDFFAGAQELKTTLIIPEQRLQAHLFNLIATGQYRELHNPNYSLVSNPFNNAYQNCTEYVLDLLNAAIYSSIDKDQLKANTKAYFEPYKVRKSRFLAGLGSLFTDDYTTADHRGDIQTATFTTLQNYLQTYNLIALVETLEWQDE